MELPILAVLLSSFILTVNPHPKHSDVIPKEYYKRQILQPIPGYIPVYIKTEEPIVRSRGKNPSPNVHTQKVNDPEEKNLLNPADEKSAPKNDKIILEGVKNTKSDNGKSEMTQSLSNPGAKQDELKS